jgi:hypothetical protein
MRVLEIQEENRRNPPPVAEVPKTATAAAAEPEKTMQKDPSNTRTVTSDGIAEDPAFQNPSQVEVQTTPGEGSLIIKPQEVKA